MVEKGVDYYFIKIHPCTDQMVQASRAVLPVLGSTRGD